MTAEIIAIGSELTCGAKLDTNSQWLSRELEALGWTVTRHTQLSDDPAQIAEEFRAACRRSRVILVTGGLGPTLDDVTRDALALAFEQKLVVDDESVRQIRAIFAARGREMPERNMRQAERPETARALPNRCGTAPGIAMCVPQPPLASGDTTDAGAADGDAMRAEVPIGGGTRQVGLPSSSGSFIAVLPGVPAEMKPMFEEQVRPLLTASGVVTHRSVVRTFGYGESDAERLLGELTARGRNPEVGITASEAVISLWVTARAPTDAESQAMAREVRQQIVDRLGPAIYADGDQELHEVVDEQLLAGGHRVALIEGSTTGGLVAEWLTEDVRWRPCLALGRIDVSLSLLSELPAEHWEQQVTRKAGDVLSSGRADFVILSSPHDDVVSEEGIRMKRGWVAVAGENFLQTGDVSMSGNLAIFRQRAARTALNLLRLHLLKSTCVR